MNKITDYRTDYEKQRDERDARVVERFKELRAEGLCNARTCMVISREITIGTTTVYEVVKRAGIDPKTYNPQNN